MNMNKSLALAYDHAMNKIVVAISLTIIIVFSGSILLFSQNINEKPQSKKPNNTNVTENTNQTVSVKIIEFKLGSGWGTPAGVTIATSFNLTLQNLENKDINGLTVEVKMLDAKGNEIQTESYFFGPGIIGQGAQIEPFDGMLHAAEVRTLRGGITSDWGTMSAAWDLGKVTTVIDVKLGNETLDEWRSTS
jgi:hypothetical protein